MNAETIYILSLPDPSDQKPIYFNAIKATLYKFDSAAVESFRNCCTDSQFIQDDQVSVRLIAIGGCPGLNFFEWLAYSCIGLDRLTLVRLGHRRAWIKGNLERRWNEMTSETYSEEESDDTTSPEFVFLGWKYFQTVMGIEIVLSN
jgi:hypothetical protein